MQITEETIRQGTIEEFADKHGLTMQVRERRLPVGDRNRFDAYFESCEVKEGGILISSFGNGATLEEAIANYAREISLKRLVCNAYGTDRREVDVWRLDG